MVAALFAVLSFATIYFRLLGRLAFLFSQKIEVVEPMLEDFEPLKEDLDSELPIHV